MLGLLTNLFGLHVTVSIYKCVLRTYMRKRLYVIFFVVFVKIYLLLGITEIVIIINCHQL